MKKNTKFKIIIAILGILLAFSLAFNIVSVVNYNRLKINNNDEKNIVRNEHFNSELIGTWCCDNNEIIIMEDGSYTWTYYANGDDPYIVECERGYISDNVMVVISIYSRLWDNIAGYEGIKHTDYYYSSEEIPDQEWETSGKKSGGYQIILHGPSFGLRTDSDVTEYNFVKQ